MICSPPQLSCNLSLVILSLVHELMHIFFCSSMKLLTTLLFPPIDHHYKGDVCETVEKTPAAADEVIYDFFHEFLIQSFYIYES